MSLKQMMTEKEPGACAAMEVKLLLQEGDICWSPSLGTEDAGVGRTVLESLESISMIGSAVERIDSGEGPVRPPSSCSREGAQSIFQIWSVWSTPRCKSQQSSQRQCKTNPTLWSLAGFKPLDHVIEIEVSLHAELYSVGCR